MCMQTSQPVRPWATWRLLILAGLPNAVFAATFAVLGCWLFWKVFSWHVAPAHLILDQAFLWIWLGLFVLVFTEVFFISAFSLRTIHLCGIKVSEHNEK